MSREKLLLEVKKNIWNTLLEKWAEVAKGPIDKTVYQTPRRIEKRLEHFIEHCLPYLKGKDVIEFGCNSGFFGLNIDEVSKSYVGIEPGQKIAKKKKKSRTDYFAQALITKEVMSKDAQFLNLTVEEYASQPHEFNALVMCFVLYHLTDKEITILSEKILPKCDTVIVQNRNQKRPKKHNSYKFWKTRNIEKFLKSRGFEVKTVWDEGEKFAEVIGTRKAKESTLPPEVIKAGNKTIKQLKKAAHKVVVKAAKKSVKKSVKKKVTKKSAVKAAKKVVKDDSQG